MMFISGDTVSRRRPSRRTGLALALAAVCALICAVPAGAIEPKIRELSARRVERMAPKAKEAYAEALAALDKINYPVALERLETASDVEPENIRLRLMVVQLAYYMGKTRSGSKLIASDNSPTALDYYTQCLKHLKAIAASPELNKRERSRTNAAIERISELRATVGERDELRREDGRMIAERYAQERAADEDEEALREERRQMGGSTGGTRSTSGGSGGSSSELTSYSDTVNSRQVQEMSAIRQGVYASQ